MDDWIDIQKDEKHVAREREKARVLKRVSGGSSCWVPGVVITVARKSGLVS